MDLVKCGESGESGERTLGVSALPQKSETERQRREIRKPGASVERSETRRPWFSSTREARAVITAGLRPFQGSKGLTLLPRGDAFRFAPRLPLAFVCRAFGAGRRDF